MFRVLAVEQPQAVVLNYAPGPLDTPMITELLADQRTDPGQWTVQSGYEMLTLLFQLSELCLKI